MYTFKKNIFDVGHPGVPGSWLQKQNYRDHEPGFQGHGRQPCCVMYFCQSKFTDVQWNSIKVICSSREMDETKVIYHIDDEETPYLVKIPISPEKVTLADFKNVLNRPNYKFFFKSMDDDFGLVLISLAAFSCDLAWYFAFLGIWEAVIDFFDVGVVTPFMQTSIKTCSTSLSHFLVYIFANLTFHLRLMALVYINGEELKFVCIFSVVKEEIVDDGAHLPCFNGRVVSWVNIPFIFIYSLTFICFSSINLVAHFLCL